MNNCPEKTKSPISESQSKAGLLVNTAVHLSVVEIAVGSLLHSFKVPLAGHFLSLNQGAFLCRALLPQESRLANAQMALEISVIASLMKSFSPAGKKLGPMISISCQGFLFALGILCGGRGLVGQMLAMMALSLWAFLQPFVTYYLIYGSDLLGAAAYFAEKFTAQLNWQETTLVWLVATVVAGKCLLAAAVPLAVKAFGKKRWQEVDAKIMALGKKSALVRRREGLPVWRGVLSDLNQPLFVFSVILIPSYLLLTGTGAAKVLWYFLRFLSTAAVIFYLLRSQHVKKISGYLAARSPYFRRLHGLAEEGVVRLSTSMRLDTRIDKE